ncbi:hypothetical protein GCM10022631_03880 [Deinococcus rubellus]|uniref:Uncharacterized protein n=1 Tax=Deinococcus rubellus TaxID=1889240 RepID=A0ABY5YE81_9DEIO|nr:hypothetical protein [Deinococcus rubellus]UWX63333.1 hypothetical protein N0D28_11315 [Deinococcus rubellus]
MGEGKPNANAEGRQVEAQMEENFAPQTVPEEKSDEYWDDTSDKGTQVESHDTPQTAAPAPGVGSIPEKSVTYGSLKDGMTPSGTTTDPEGQAGTPKLGQD